MFRSLDCSWNTVIYLAHILNNLPALTNSHLKPEALTSELSPQCFFQLRNYQVVICLNLSSTVSILHCSQKDREKTQKEPTWDRAHEESWHTDRLWGLDDMHATATTAAQVNTNSALALGCSLMQLNCIVLDAGRLLYFFNKEWALEKNAKSK